MEVYQCTEKQLYLVKAPYFLLPSRVFLLVLFLFFFFSRNYFPFGFVDGMCNLTFTAPITTAADDIHK